MEKFRQLKLSEEILKALHDVGFHEPSEIQNKAIPLILEGKDLIGSSSTGSGKTIAFGAGIIAKIKKNEGIQALILTPTRELAEQVTQHLKVLSRYYGLNINEIYGGVSIEPQVHALRKSEIVVGTPGRILDHLGRRTLHLDKVRFLVLDEADKMLEMGFIEDVQKIINECPGQRQTLLFSATISKDIEFLAKRYMKNPVYVEVENYVDASKLKQVYYDVPQNLKFSLLVHLLKQEKSGFVMVFCNTRKNTDLVASNLKRYNLHALAIHGGLPQNKRNSILKSFHSKEALILICTDVAARGLDIKDISHVYNYDTPKISKDYIHRIGRTARAGKEGIAVSLVSSYDYENFRKVINDEEIKVNNEPLPKLEPLSVDFTTSRKSNFGEGRSGGRGNFSSRSYGERPRYQGSRSSHSSSGGGRYSSGNRPQGRRYSESSSGGQSSSGNRPPGRASYGRSSGRSGGSRERSFGRKRW
jgi:superfamily II DNA/RNA helicase